MFSLRLLAATLAAVLAAAPVFADPPEPSLLPLSAAPPVSAAGVATATGGASAARSAMTVQPSQRGKILSGPTMQKISVGPISMKHIEPSTLNELLTRASDALREAVGEPHCTITTYSVRYNTVGGHGEPTDASAAIITPTGKEAMCKGDRPILLYAHGTSIAKDHNMARLRGEAQLVAALFASQGYIVVAPNYAGYDGSSLPYHPYLNAEQQSADMVDALRAAHIALARLKQGYSQQLFVAGYSQGGFVALATQRAIQQQYSNEFTVTAAAGLSGPYALAQFSDNVFSGKPNAGITVYLPLIATSAQKAGAAIYGTPGDFYESQYAAGIETLLPGSMSRTDLFKRGKLPTRGLFAPDSQPQSAGASAFFADPHLVRSSYRDAYLQDMASFPCNGDPGAGCTSHNNLRKWMLKNDLRSYTPQSPLLLCGGAGDQAVPFANATATASYFEAHGSKPVLLDLEAHAQQDQFTPLRLSFAHVLETARASAIKDGKNPDEAVGERYHSRYAAPFCLLAARQFFNASLR
ncbi:alpha/beta hydrolase family protein [Pseudoduganella sp. RAF53_2]|uniref:alpha/beta hydrolase family protein n=1 Tax=unclassified Pseudoduganella TaxID=2637179 RepID=UPI003F98A32D